MSILKIRLTSLKNDNADNEETDTDQSKEPAIYGSLVVDITDTKT